jgi:dienelactone hydrolase
VCKLIPENRGAPPVESLTPAGPRVEENMGRVTAHRTYTNLLQSPHDEALLEYYLTSSVEWISLAGRRQVLAFPCLVSAALPSPNGEYLLLKTWHKPFSYQLPIRYFPQTVTIINLKGQLIHQLVDRPLADSVTTHFDSVRPGPRNVNWRPDQSATLFWLEALDDGDASKDVPLHDSLLQLPAPFVSKSINLLSNFEFRVSHIYWGCDQLALVQEEWRDIRLERLWQINPMEPHIPPRLLREWSSDDRYSNPGTPLTTYSLYGREVLQLSQDENSIYLSGAGASSAGVYPFLDQLNLESSIALRLWQCQDPYYEYVTQLLDKDGQQRLTMRQSQIEPPNFFIQHSVQSIQITSNIDPSPQLADLSKEVVQYERWDGVKLSGTLYLPPGHRETDGSLPTIFWIYPEDFKQRNHAGQIKTPRNKFSRPKRASYLYLLTQGYAVFANPSLPIIGEGEVEPNDSYIEQLVAGAKAAVDYLVMRGIADPARLGVGGHSYGAFTTANLLAHTDLFQAGVARNGAYNRTLTPFGFQGEQRHYWQAIDTYTQISPFTHADKIKKPLLLIHGTNDKNTGTYPLQSERFYQALKGVGATVRLVMLPGEDHNYRSREAVGQVLWETIRWFNLYVGEGN